MKLGVIGFPSSGKTSLFNAITGGNYPVGQPAAPHTTLALMRVPDSRLDHLHRLYKRPNCIHASVDCLDFTGLISGTGGAGGKEVKGEMMGKLREVDGIVQVVRAFENANVPHVLETVDPVRDIAETNNELVFADMVQCEARLTKLRHQEKSHHLHEQERKELATLERLLPLLEGGKPAREFQPANDDERKHVAAFQFLSAKKQVVVFNVGEEDLVPGGAAERLQAEQPGCLAVCAELEMEVARMPEEEREGFLKDLGLGEPAVKRLARQAYAALDAISFFTIGDQEVRAWTLRRGGTALDAAAKVHTDLARGFVRAEVFAYDDLAAAGDEKALKAAGKWRLEGKDHVIKDGDVVYIRANTR